MRFRFRWVQAVIRELAYKLWVCVGLSCRLDVEVV